MVKLPEEPDDAAPARLAGRATSSTAPSTTAARSSAPQERHFIARYRLEKKDPTAAISEPVKPIVYYVDPATPDWLKPWVKKGIEEWQVAFEAAGFRNAIVAKDAPTKAEDPDWSPEDARYSVVRWLPSTIENAQRPAQLRPAHRRDPRTPT